MSGFTGAPHLGAMAFTVVAALGVCASARRWPGAWTRCFGRALGVLIVVNEVWYIAQLVLTDRFTARFSLPLYLCDVAAFIAGVALWWPRPFLVELTWFWALAGTLQGIITPDQYPPFPSYDWFQFYIDHIGVVLGRPSWWWVCAIIHVGARWCGSSRPPCCSQPSWALLM